jgi:hypothetical protein
MCLRDLEIIERLMVSYSETLQAKQEAKYTHKLIKKLSNQ